MLAYLVCSTQWRSGAMGRTGLDYIACQVATDAQRERLRLPPWPELFADLQTIEQAILACDSEYRERERRRREQQAASQ